MSKNHRGDAVASASASVSFFEASTVKVTGNEGGDTTWLRLEVVASEFEDSRHVAHVDVECSIFGTPDELRDIADRIRAAVDAEWPPECQLGAHREGCSHETPAGATP